MGPQIYKRSNKAFCSVLFCSIHTETDTDTMPAKRHEQDCILPCNERHRNASSRAIRLTPGCHRRWRAVVLLTDSQLHIEVVEAGKWRPGTAALHLIPAVIQTQIQTRTQTRIQTQILTRIPTAIVQDGAAGRHCLPPPDPASDTPASCLLAIHSRPSWRLQRRRTPNSARSALLAGRGSVRGGELAIGHCRPHTHGRRTPVSRPGVAGGGSVPASRTHSRVKRLLSAALISACHWLSSHSPLTAVAGQQLSPSPHITITVYKDTS